MVYHALQRSLCLMWRCCTVEDLSTARVTALALISMWYYKKITTWKRFKVELWKVEGPWALTPTTKPPSFFLNEEEQGGITLEGFSMRFSFLSGHMRPRSGSSTRVPDHGPPDRERRLPSCHKGANIPSPDLNSPLQTWLMLPPVWYRFNSASIRTQML